ncbi:MAG: hypothetical protein PHS37_06915 [Candidatus Omnitrophica bacterium]|nr:hypothetical protein [Candidatus Omnitrophota bacterium]
MAENGKGLTAEQQLLALIESQDKDARALPSASGQTDTAKPQGRPGPGGLLGAAFKRGSGSSQMPIARRKVPVLSPDVLKARMAYALDVLKKAVKGQDMELSLSLVNNALVVGICVLFVFLGYEIFIKPKEFKMLPQIITAKKVQETAETSKEEPRDIGFYLNKLGLRDVFKAKPKEEPKAAKAEIVKPPPIIEGAIKDLKLVGLSPSADRSMNYAMIENTKTQATFFLKEGDTVSGLRVESVGDDKVILSDGTETRELK